MTDLTDKPANINRIEFWAATTLFVFMLFFFFTTAQDGDFLRVRRGFFERANVPFNYYANYFFPQLVRYVVLFPAFLLSNFIIVPQLIKKQRLYLNIFLIISLVALIGLVLSVTDTYLKGHLFTVGKPIQDVYNSIFLNAYIFTARLVLLFLFYTILKYACLYLLFNSEKIRARYRFVTPAGLAASVIYMIVLFLLAAGDAEKEIVLAWSILIPFGIGLYWYAFYSLIPKSLQKKKSFLLFIGKVLLVLAIAYLPVAFLILFFAQNDDIAFSFSFLNSVFQLFITAPFSWVLFKRHLKGNEELYALKTELGQSHANLDFLRSQINPHFLFNALNTIYGTAIQENAERTSEGIERLGDMMRFMLQENLQDKISLTREIEYLNNYISLQRLRTDTNPIIKIEADIAQTVSTVQIAPMLLIPFVENAFKHGISFRETSYIKITLEVRDNTLYFDVYNSKHIRSENDPEQNKSGIGLTNVKQRLQLLYPGKHDIMIRETGKEFFVHLTIQLER
jgi:sensor histidine kinase YesM